MYRMDFEIVVITCRNCVVYMVAAGWGQGYAEGLGTQLNHLVVGGMITLFSKYH